MSAEELAKRLRSERCGFTGCDNKATPAELMILGCCTRCWNRNWTLSRQADAYARVLRIREGGK